MSTTADREIVTSRLYDAPPERVYAAWTDAAHVGLWWGPDGFTTVTESMEVRPGGRWIYVMRGPDGTDYDNRVEYIEVVPNERLVYLHGGAEPDPAADFHVTVTFEAQGARTLLTMRALFATAAARDHVVREYGAIEGAHQTLARLAGYLNAP